MHICHLGPSTQVVCNKGKAVTLSQAEPALLLARKAQAATHKQQICKRYFEITTTAETVDAALSTARALHTDKLLPASTQHAL